TWPAEDDRRDAFNNHVREQALALLGADLARSEKFTTSVMDGLDIRKVVHVDHHNCHAASAYYQSGFDEALVMTLDGLVYTFEVHVGSKKLANGDMNGAKAFLTPQAQGPGQHRHGRRR
ncbi:MAG: hypothetical protein HC779_03465, partial [Phyllobacteriaceae bacterium]|nr:hypothetical protein [Phyllobacteriaceae bacterium]